MISTDNVDWLFTQHRGCSLLKLFFSISGTLDKELDPSGPCVHKVITRNG